jgi:hypothetical protein
MSEDAMSTHPYDFSRFSEAIYDLGVRDRKPAAAAQSNGRQGDPEKGLWTIRASAGSQHDDQRTV